VYLIQTGPPMSKKPRIDGQEEANMASARQEHISGHENEGNSSRSPEGSKIPHISNIGGGRRRTLIVDNYDSYTHNLFHLVYSVTGDEPLVIRNNDWDSYEKLKNSQMLFNIILSPGPGRPDRHEDFGVCRRILDDASVPVLGVCLGFQGLGLAYGMEVGI